MDLASASLSKRPRPPSATATAKTVPHDFVAVQTNSQGDVLAVGGTDVGLPCRLIRSPEDSQSARFCGEAVFRATLCVHLQSMD